MGLGSDEEEPLRVRAREDEEDPSPNTCLRRVVVLLCMSAGEMNVGVNPPAAAIDMTSGVTGRDAPPRDKLEGGRIGAASREDVDEVVRDEHCESLRDGGDGGREASRTRLRGGLNGISEKSLLVAFQR